MCAAGLLDDVQTLYRYSPRCLWHLSILPSLLPDIPIRKFEGENNEHDDPLQR